MQLPWRAMVAMSVLSVKVDAFLLHFVGQHAAELAVEAAQDARAAIDQRWSLRAEAVEDGGELERDVAAADHQRARRQRRRGEDASFEVIAQLGAWNRGHHRPAAGSDQDMLAAV